jgi:dolichol-phosphate mannosyltransferase
MSEKTPPSTDEADGVDEGSERPTDSPPKFILRRLADRFLTQEQKRFVKFGIVGSSGVVVNLCFVWLALQGLASFAVDCGDGCIGSGTEQAIASAVGILVSVFTNFLLNDVWTWGDRQKGVGVGSFVFRVLRYYLASALAIAIQYGAAIALVQGWEANIYVGQLGGIALGTVVNFLINNIWTFREVDTDKLEKPSQS